MNDAISNKNIASLGMTRKDSSELNKNLMLKKLSLDLFIFAEVILDLVLQLFALLETCQVLGATPRGQSTPGIRHKFIGVGGKVGL